MREARTLLTALLLSLLAGCAGTPDGDVSGGKNETPSTPAEARLSSGEIERDFEKATELLRDGQYQQGLDLLDRLLRDRDARKNPALQINRGIAYEKLGKLEQAEEAFKAALAVEPDHPAANNEYGMVLRRAGRFAEARAAYERALASHPAFLPARRNLGILCDLYLRDLACAMEQYQAYAAAYPDDKAVAAWIADLQQKMDKKE